MLECPLPLVQKFSGIKGGSEDRRAALETQSPAQTRARDFAGWKITHNDGKSWRMSLSKRVVGVPAKRDRRARRDKVANYAQVCPNLFGFNLFEAKKVIKTH